MNHHSISVIGALALAALPTFPAMGADVARTATAGQMSPVDQPAAIAAAKEVTPEKYPNADTVLVTEHVRTEYQADGSFVCHDDEYVKVLTEAGRGAGTRQFSYNVFYGGLEIVAAEIIKADSRVVKHDPKAISKEQVDRAQMDANIYDPNDKMMVAALPGVEIGDTIRYFVKRWESKPRMQGCYADWQVLESTMPIRHVTYEYVGPKDHPLKSKALLSEIKGTVTATETVVGDRIRYTWTGRDVPQVFQEPGMPSLQTVAQRLLVSTVPEWKDVSRWYYDLCKGHLEKTNDGIKAKTRELTAHATTEMEKIRAIFKFVSQEIRYMGITTETDAPGYEPHDVNITFDNRYGVCRDKAALLAAMLGEAGIPAFPVIIMVGEKLDREVPSATFNHAITAARTSDGNYVLMDSTNENTADLLPQYLYNRSYLVATPEGETLMTSPVSPADDNMALAKTDVVLAEDGSATGTTVVDMKGINDVAYRGQLAQAKPDDIRRFFEGAVKSTVAGATVTDFKLEPEDLRDTTRNLRISIGWTVPSLLVTGGDAAQLDLPFCGYHFGIALQAVGQSLELEKRRFPLDLDLTCGVREDLSIQLPPALAQPVSLPQYDNTEHRDFSLVQQIGAEGGVLKASIDIRLKSPTVEPPDYLILKQAMAKVQANSRQQPVFKLRAGVSPRKPASAPAEPPAPVTADVEVIHSKVDVRVDSASAWKSRREVKKRILTYGGKKSNSELKFDYNPVWESVNLEYARVTQKDGTVRAIQPQEMNTLDAAWVASAPRYPGAKTLVVSLPGVEVGSVIEYAVSTTVKDRLMFSSAHAFASRDEVKLTEVSYDFPESLNPQLVMDFPKENHMTDTTAGGRRKISFTWRDIAPQAGERSAPPAWVDAPDFAMSTGKWADYATALGTRVSRLADNQSASQAKAAELVADINDPMAKITAIRDFVARQIRAAGPGFAEFPLDVAFSPADVTLKDGYGHAADRAILLHAMLTSAGFDSQLALASGVDVEPTLLKRSLEVPETGTFGNLVCRVKHPVSKEWLPLDRLSQYAPVGVTSLDGQPGYTLDGQAFIWTAPATLENTGETRLDLDFSADGTALITVTKLHHGTDHEEFVRKYREMTPEDRKRDFQGLVSGIAQNAVAQGEPVIDYTYPGTLRYTVRVANYGVKNGGGLYFDLPGVPQQLVPADGNTRQRPLLVSGKSKARVSWSVTAPGGLKPVIQPESLDWKGPASLGSIRFVSSSMQKDGKTRLDYTLDLDTRPALVEPAGYPGLLDLNRRFSHAAARRVLLQ